MGYGLPLTYNLSPMTYYLSRLYAFPNPKSEIPNSSMPYHVTYGKILLHIALN
jgi:hypothetical protein